MIWEISRERGGFILTVAAAVAFASKTVLAKMSYRYGVDALTVLTLRMAFAGGLVGLIMAWNLLRGRWTLRFSPGQWLQAIFLGLFGYYLSSLLDFSGLVYVDASLGRMILFLYPTLVLIINAFLRHQAVRGSTWLALAFCYGGIFLMMLPNLGGSQTNFWLGSALIFGAAVTYAFYLTGIDRLLKSVNPMMFSSLILCISCLGVLTHFLLAKDLASLAVPRPVLINGALMGVFSTVLPIYALSFGIFSIGASKAAMISMIGPVLTSIMGFFLLGERLAPLQIAGMFLVMAGVWRVGK